MSWQDYVKMSTRQRRKLARDAQRGDKVAQAMLVSYTRDIKKEVNTRLRSLERSNLDYGKVYNNITFFTQTEYDTNRFKSPTALKYDYEAMALQNDIGYKFLNTQSSTIEGARSAERHRMERLKELEIVPEGIGKRKEKEFLQFLGNEEISAAIDEYGTSDVIVEMFFDIYESDGRDGLSKVQRSMAEFLDGQVTFDDAMERSGIKVEDYISRRPTS